MYKEKEKSYAVIAFVYYFISLSGFLVMGIMYKNDIPCYFLINLILIIAAVLTVILKDKSLINLGFSNKKIGRNLLAAFSVIAVSVSLAFIVGSLPANKILKGTAYFLFYIALPEEMIFRGFLQNYLFGLKTDRKLIFIICALMFSFMHLPFQMYVNGNPSFSYFLESAPQLIFTFLLHLIMCFITKKTGDIIIPVSLHFALDFIQEVLQNM
ncbi:MAG: CPBP family intramembrane metalloprotease [Ruminococcaceae bacterium]|nr:CPBP family intramembrane metalloprotease [Oscillospiraceae bacterium]